MMFGMEKVGSGYCSKVELLKGRSSCLTLGLEGREEMFKRVEDPFYYLNDKDTTATCLPSSRRKRRPIVYSR